MRLEFTIHHRTKTGMNIQFTKVIEEKDIMGYLVLMRDSQVMYKEDKRLNELGEELFRQFVSMMQVKDYLRD